MARVAISELDEVPAEDGDNTFIGGQASAAQESAVPKGAFAAAQNMDFDPFGRLSTRRGARSVTGNVETRDWEDVAVNWNANSMVWGNTLGATAIDSCFFFDTQASEVVVIAQGAALKQGTEGGAYSTITGASYSGSSVYFAQLNNRLYYCDGVNALAYVDSAFANQAITAGKVGSIRITTQGQGYTSVPTITFSSGAAAATAVLGMGGRVISATVGAAGSGYSATTPPTISFTAAPSGGVTAQGVVNLTQLPSKPQFLVAHTNRLFCTSANTSNPPDTIYASYFLDGESWDLAGASVRVGGDGDPITGLYSWYGNTLLVFKQRSIWTVDCDPLVDPANWQIKLVTGRIGCVSHRSIQSVGSDVYFLAQDGVRSVGQIQAGSQTDVGQPISAPIQDKVDGINKAALSTICSSFYRNRYFIAVPIGSATTPDTVLVWNQLSKSWCGSWTGWAPREFCVTGFSGRIRLNFADNNGKFWTWDDYTPAASETTSQYQDDTATYESFVITRGYTCNDPLVDKLGHAVQVVTENRLTDGIVTAYLSYDPDASGTFTTLDSSIEVAVGDRLFRKTVNLLSKGKFNVVQFKFGATRWKTSLAAITLTAFPDTIKPELN